MAPPLTSPFHTLKVGDFLRAHSRKEYDSLISRAVKYRSRYGIDMRLRSLRDAEGWKVYRLS